MARSNAAYTFAKTPEQQGRDAFRAAKTIGRLTQASEARQTLYAALLKRRSDAIAAGVPATALPEIHPNMSPQDISAADTQISRYTQRPSPGKPSAAVAPGAPAPSSSGFTGFLPPRAAGAAGAAFGGAPAATSPTAPGLPKGRPGQAFISPALDSQGNQMTNWDGSPRTVARQPSAEEALRAKFPGWETMAPAEKANTLRSNPANPNVGVTTGTGTSAFNFAGERNVNSVGTQGEMAREYDPTKDQTKSYLPAGDPLLPRDAVGGVVVNPKYVAPGASPVGFTRQGPAVTGQSDADPLSFAPKPAPVVAASTPDQNTAAGIGYSASLPRPNGVKAQPGLGFIDARTGKAPVAEPSASVMVKKPGPVGGVINGPLNFSPQEKFQNSVQQDGPSVVAGKLASSMIGGDGGAMKAAPALPVKKKKPEDQLPAWTDFPMLGGG